MNNDNKKNTVHLLGRIGWRFSVQAYPTVSGIVDYYLVYDSAYRSKYPEVIRPVSKAEYADADGDDDNKRFNVPAAYGEVVRRHEPELTKEEYPAFAWISPELLSIICGQAQPFPIAKVYDPGALLRSVMLTGFVVDESTERAK
uniref:Uncharacterized protein n=1 Tax=viral metagenome TaxID=1070528 RepID=A0A6M3J538_9ZZZZ